MGPELVLLCSPKGIRTRVATLRERASGSIGSYGVAFCQVSALASSRPSAQLDQVWLHSWAIGWASEPVKPAPWFEHRASGETPATRPSGASTNRNAGHGLNEREVDGSGADGGDVGALELSRSSPSGSRLHTAPKLLEARDFLGSPRLKVGSFSRSIPCRIDGQLMKSRGPRHRPGRSRVPGWASS